ncbi:MAG: ATP-binding protein [Terriglobia bacterium]
MLALPPGVRDRYKKALHDYLVKADEASLHEAYELGREALDPAVGLLGWIEMHGFVLSELMDKEFSVARPVFHAANQFLIESLSLFEMLQINHRDSNNALRKLNQILEEKVKQIALSLHDESAQLLATVYLELAEIERERPARSVALHVQHIKSHLDLVNQQLHHISHELSPPALHQLGFIPALNFLADGISKRNGLDVSVESKPAAETRFPPAIETALYRTVQEALNNIVRHAQASRATINVNADEQLVICTIEDNGIGFDPSTLGEKARGLGMLGIQGRANSLYGTLQVTSSPGAGTTLRIAIPLSEKAS